MPEKDRRFVDRRVSRRSISDGTLVSIIIPCFNEEATLRDTYERLKATLKKDSRINFEMIFVDDGSRDNTFSVLKQIQKAEKRVRVVAFSRNFGHQIAVSAGIEHATGDAVVIIDADLQDPPEMISNMFDRWLNGTDVVYGLRTEREGETAFKLWTAKVFYRIINGVSEVPIPFDTGDFRLMDRCVVDSLLMMPERYRFVRGMASWAGFRQEAIPYKRARRFAGSTKYPLKNMLRLAADGIFSFSIIPLRLASLFGFIASGFSLLGIIYALVLRVLTNIWVPGWTALFIAVLFLGGIQLIFLGVIGEYLGRVYGEVKRRPLYLVKERLGFPDTHTLPANDRMKAQSM